MPRTIIRVTVIKTCECVNFIGVTCSRTFAAESLIFCGEIDLRKAETKNTRTSDEFFFGCGGTRQMWPQIGFSTHHLRVQQRGKAEEYFNLTHFITSFKNGLYFLALWVALQSLVKSVSAL